MQIKLPSFYNPSKGTFCCRTMRENTGLGVRVIYLTCDYSLLARSLFWALSIGQQAKTFRLLGCVTPNMLGILRSTSHIYHETFLPTYFQFSVDDAIYTYPS